MTSDKKIFGLEWALYEFVKGTLMVENFHKVEKNHQIEDFLKLEGKKEVILENLHSQQKKLLTKKEFLESRVNKLFYKRLTGKRYKKFYRVSTQNISRYFNKKIKLNNETFDNTINEIFQRIKKKYLVNIDNIPSILGHGDAHHGNIITNDKIWFIDNEYADYMTPYTELAKPYHNDFIGTLFFHYEKLLKEYFQLVDFQITKNKIEIKIKKIKNMDSRLKMTKKKLVIRKNTIREDNKDILSLNDYLILCHTLTKDPNDYSSYRQKMFLAFTTILADFDPFNPESLYSYF